MSFSDIFASFVVFFFWFMAIWIFIAVFADIFRRNDIHGLAKAGWIVLIFLIPFVGRADLHHRPAEDDGAGQAGDRRRPGGTATRDAAIPRPMRSRSWASSATRAR